METTWTSNYYHQNSPLNSSSANFVIKKRGGWNPKGWHNAINCRSCTQQIDNGWWVLIDDEGVTTGLWVFCLLFYCLLQVIVWLLNLWKRHLAFEVWIVAHGRKQKMELLSWVFWRIQFMEWLGVLLYEVLQVFADQGSTILFVWRCEKGSWWR